MSLACIWVYGGSNVQCLAQWSVLKRFCHRWRNVFAKEMCRTYLLQLIYEVSAMFEETMYGGWPGMVRRSIIKKFTSPADKYLWRDCPASVSKVFSE